MKNGFSGGVIRMAAILLAGLPSALTGCGIVDEGGTPENARVVIEEGGGQAFDLVTSSDFLLVADDDGGTLDVFLNDADTLTVTSPFDRRYSLGPAVRFYMHASSEGGLAQPVTVKVFIDGERRYNLSSTLGETDLEFVYTYR